MKTNNEGIIRFEAPEETAERRLKPPPCRHAYVEIGRTLGAEHFISMMRQVREGMEALYPGESLMFAAGKTRLLGEGGDAFAAEKLAAGWTLWIFHEDGVLRRFEAASGHFTRGASNP
jgi:hypothetical protein